MTDTLVQDYLERLTRAADRLPPERRAELVEEIREHIESAVAEGEAGTEAELRDLLDRLGDPEEIVAAASEDEPAAPSALGRYRRPGIGVEIGAVALLTLGSLVIVVGWAIGAILLWTSRRWTTGEKLLGTLVVPGGPFLALVALPFGGQVCSSTQTMTEAGVETTVEAQCSGFAFPPAVGIPLLLAWLILPFVVGGVLLGRARKRADAEPPVLDTGTSRWGGLEIAAVLLLAVGGFLLPLVGSVAGLVCAWASRMWTTTEKGVATAIAATGLLVPTLGLLLFRTSEPLSPLDLSLPLLVLFALAGALTSPIAALFLAIRLNSRR